MIVIKDGYVMDQNHSKKFEVAMIETLKNLEFRYPGAIALKSCVHFDANNDYVSLEFIFEGKIQRISMDDGGFGMYVMGSSDTKSKSSEERDSHISDWFVLSPLHIVDVVGYYEFYQIAEINSEGGEIDEE